MFAQTSPLAKHYAGKICNVSMLHTCQSSKLNSKVDRHWSRRVQSQNHLVPQQTVKRNLSFS